MAFVRKRKGRNVPTIRIWDPALGKKRDIGAGSAEAKQVRAKKLALEGKTQNNEKIDTRVNKITFDDGVKLIYDNYRLKERKSIKDLTFTIDNHLRPYFGGMLLARITYELLVEYFIERKSGKSEPTQVKKRRKPAGLGTMRRELAAIRRIFKLALKAKRITADVVPSFPEIAKPKPRKGFFEPWQVNAIKAECKEQVLRDLLDLYNACGWRKRNLLNLEWTNINRFHGVMTVDTGETKSGEPLSFPYASDPALLAIIERRWLEKEFAEEESGCDVPWVFFRYTPKRPKQKPGGVANGMTTPAAPRPVKGIRLTMRAQRAAKKLGDTEIRTRTVHDFRRTAVRRFSRSGVPDKVVMDTIGQKTRSIFDDYNITNDRDQRTAVAAAAEYAAREQQHAADVVEMGKGGLGVGRGVGRSDSGKKAGNDK